MTIKKKKGRRSFKTRNRKPIYLIAILCIAGAFFLLYGYTKMGENISSTIIHFHWIQIIIGLVIGFLLGGFFARRKVNPH